MASSQNSEAPVNRDAARPVSFAAVPGWMVSGTLHAVVIVFLITSGLPSCGDGQIGTGAKTDEFRGVGVYVKQSDTKALPDEAPESESPEEFPTEKATTTKPVASPAKEIEATAAELIDVPDVAPRTVIGQAATVPIGNGVPNPSDALVTSNAVRTPASPGSGPGEVSFMGKTTPAERVVYVIDKSSSMNKRGAIQYAKAKLKQSINGLTQKQLFQIIVYDDTPDVMELSSAKKSEAMYRAHGINLRKATREINAITAVGGTNHMLALEKAFALKPDVIFFLTDDSKTGIAPRDMNKIRNTWNRARKIHIHCIMFGRGADLKPKTENFMRVLASENQGSYTYMDIDRLGSP